MFMKKPNLPWSANIVLGHVFIGQDVTMNHCMVNLPKSTEVEFQSVALSIGDPGDGEFAAEFFVKRRRARWKKICAVKVAPFTIGATIEPPRNVTKLKQGDALRVDVLSTGSINHVYITLCGVLERLK